jgi:hypothetical protein
MGSQSEQSSGGESQKGKVLGVIYGTIGRVVQEEDGSVHITCTPEEMDLLLQHDLPFLQGFRERSQQLLAGQLVDDQGHPIPVHLVSYEARVAFSHLLEGESRWNPWRMKVIPTSNLLRALSREWGEGEE